MTFHSKVDRWLLAVLVLASLLPMLIAATASVRGEPWLIHVLAAALLAGFFTWLVLSTKYTIQDGALLVRSGPFKWAIEVSSITDLTPSSSALSGPALSLDRLRIDYERGRKSLLVSPEDKEGFIKALQSAKSAA